MKNGKTVPQRAVLAGAALGMFVLLQAAGSGELQAATLLHHYDFTSGVEDLAGDDDGTLVNGAVIENGRLVLDGVNDYVQFTTRLVPTEGAWSVSFFARRDRDQAVHTEVVSQGMSSGPGFYVGTAPNGQIRVGDQWTSTGEPFSAPGVFAHYAVTVDPGTSSTFLYVDGALAASRTFAIAVSASGTTTRLGRQFDPFDEYFAGAIDEFRVYSGALTEAEVSTLAAPVPEPSTFVLIGAGFAGLAVWRRRRADGRKAVRPA